MAKKAYLKLANGMVFTGTYFGAEGEVTGEVVFTTGMTGYLETLTDPSYYGQIVVQTFPQIGNYGVIPEDFESGKPFLKAYIVRECCALPSNFRSEGNLDTYLKQQGIVAVCGIDTRALTRVVREYGVMNGRISLSEEFSETERIQINAYRIENAVAAVSTGEQTEQVGESLKRRVVLWDFGAKANIGRELLKRGCSVVTVPFNTTAEQIRALQPDGIMLSNGPGDPAENQGIIEELRKTAALQIPIFGICLGHQLMALSQGAETEKLKYGHRGANQPVLDIASDRVYVTSQNHGYAVKADTLPDTAELSFTNVNDKTCEGIRYRNMPAFTVQFHPEASSGPLDTRFLFDRFVELMDRCRKQSYKMD